MTVALAARPLTEQITACTTTVLQGLKPTSARKYSDSYDDLVAWLTRLCADDDLSGLADITPEHALAFIASPRRDGGTPSASTMNSRRSHLRALFRQARARGLLAGDPTLDITLPSRTSDAVPTRPLTDTEKDTLVSASRRFGSSSREATAVALALCGLTAAEIAAVGVDDVQAFGGAPTAILLPGCTTRAGRLILLDPWAQTCVQGRVLELVADGRPGAGLVAGAAAGTGKPESVDVAIRQVIRAAGLGDRPGVRPSSLPGWAGRQVYDQTGNLDTAADLLGTRSRHATAKAIGLPQVNTHTTRDITR